MSQSLLISCLSLFLTGTPVQCGDAKVEAVVEEVLGIATIRVSHEGRTEVVRFSGICGEDELREELDSTHEAGVPENDVRRFLENREMIRNFLQALMPSGSRVALHGMHRDPSGKIRADVAFDYGRGEQFLINLESVILGEGFGMPLPRLWSSTVDEENLRILPPTTQDLPSMRPGISLDEQLKMARQETAEFFTVSCFRQAYEWGEGLWADGRCQKSGMRTRPLPADCNPALAVPMLGFYFSPRSGNTTFDTSHRAAVTVICTARSDVQRVAGAAREFWPMLHEYFSSQNAADLTETSLVCQLEAELLSRLRHSIKEDTGTPRIASVQLRTLFTPAPLPK
jgi:copper chaperone CopZ